jgi:hypothetical protein
MQDTCLRNACPDCTNFSCWHGRVLSAKLCAILGQWRRGRLAYLTTRGRFVLLPTVLAKPSPIDAAASQQRTVLHCAV